MFCFFKQKTAYGMRISYWSSDVCSSDLIVAAGARLPQLDAQVLVPTGRQAERALAAGARHLSAVLSVSERHNLGNVRRTPLESANDYAEIVAKLPTGARVRLNLATAFDCPHVGRVHGDAVLVLLDRLATVTADVEIAMCKSEIGRASCRERVCKYV